MLLSIVQPSGPLYGTQEFYTKAGIYSIKNTAGLSLLNYIRNFFNLGHLQLFLGITRH